MKIRSKIACAILALSLTQTAFCFACFMLSLMTTGPTTGQKYELMRAQEIGLDAAELEAIHAGHLTPHIRDIVEDANKSDEEILAILRETLEISE